MNNDDNFPNDSHLIGDQAYPLGKHLQVAYRKTRGRLTRRQLKYNRSLSAARSVIERAFALLKGRFRRLKYLEMLQTVYIPHVIIACCILHNICLLHDDMWTVDEPEDDGTHSSKPDATYDLPSQDKAAGIMKHNHIADSL